MYVRIHDELQSDTRPTTFEPQFSIKTPKIGLSKHTHTYTYWVIVIHDLVHIKKTRTTKDIN
jgi:hypothetical protein